MNMKDSVLCVVLPAYLAGNPVPIEQYLNTPIDIFGLRRYLERFKLNEWNLKILKIPNQNVYVLGVDLDKSDVVDYDEIIRQMAIAFNVEPTTEAVAVAISDLFSLFMKPE